MREIIHNEDVRRLIALTILLAAVLYAGDYASVRFGIPPGRNPLATVTVQRSYSVMKKDGKPDFYFDPPQNQTCVRSLFPHLGYEPCWYLRRHQTQQISM
jgi:hypothetical protein